MLKLYENFHIFHFQKRIDSAETIRRNMVAIFSTIYLNSTTDNVFALIVIELAV
jgi:hypothetical protein